jgi:hypothetical protein
MPSREVSLDASRSLQSAEKTFSHLCRSGLHLLAVDLDIAAGDGASIAVDRLPRCRVGDADEKRVLGPAWVIITGVHVSSCSPAGLLVVDLNVAVEVEWLWMDLRSWRGFYGRNSPS